MDPMHEDETVELNAKAIGLAIGGAALAGLLFVLARRDDKQEPGERVEEVAAEAKERAKKAAKAAKKQQKKLAKAVDVDASAVERDLKAAAWDAQQAAKEAESRLRAAGLRVVDDAAQLATRVGAEARHLADEGKERIAHLRHRDEEGDELARLRAEVAELRERLGESGRKAERDYSRWTSRLAGKTGPIPEAAASQAASAALAHLERSLKALAPELLGAKNRAQVIEILQRELRPTLRESAVQAASAALGLWEASRERIEEAESKARERVRDAASELEEAAREAEQKAREAEQKAREAERRAREAAEDAIKEMRAATEESAEAANADGKRRFWRLREVVREEGAEAPEPVEAAVERETEESAEEERKSKSGLLWGGAGLGLALYALLDAERRDRVLHLANEASIQLQELVRDLQGYDDEF